MSGDELFSNLPIQRDVRVADPGEPRMREPVRDQIELRAVASCKAYLARLQDAKRDAALTEYPDSAHGFDAGLLGVSTVAVSVNAQSARNCRLKEGEGGVLMNDETKQPFTYQDACVERNPHVGYDLAAAAGARQEVGAFLTTLFKLY